MACKPIVCLAELKHIIEINTKENINRLFDQVDYKQKYTPYLKAYAKIINKPTQVYDGINPNSLTTQISHIFTIKYTPKKLNEGYSIIYRNKIYNIKAVRNINEANQWLELHAIYDKDKDLLHN